MARLSVDYQVVVSAQVDTDHGTVEYVVASIGGFNGSQPEAVFNAYDETLPEYLPLDHPEAVRAMEIADRIQLTRVLSFNGGEALFAMKLRPEATDGA